MSGLELAYAFALPGAFLLALVVVTVAVRLILGPDPDDR